MLGKQVTEHIGINPKGLMERGRFDVGSFMMSGLMGSANAYDYGYVGPLVLMQNKKKKWVFINLKGNVVDPGPVDFAEGLRNVEYL